MASDSTPRRWYDGLTGYHYLVIVVASLGWMFDTMDQWLYVLARQSAITDLLGAAATPETVATHSSTVQSLFLLGWATGGLLFGMIGDKLGRTRTMALTVLIYAVFTGLSGLATSTTMFGVFRFLTGLGIGGEFAAGAALVAEALPNHARPAALAIMQACSAIGNVLSGVIGYTVATVATGDDTWRYLFFIGFAPAVLVFIIRLFVHEPEQWHKAREGAARGDIKVGSIVEMFTDRVMRHHMLIGVGLAAVGVIGFWGIGTFSPDLMNAAINPTGDPALKQQVEQSKSLGVIAQNCGAFFGILAWAWLAERAGRRKAFAVSFICCAITVPLTFHFTDSLSMALLLFPIMGFFTTSLFGGYAVYFPELFPTRLRATGTGFCYNVARYIAIAGPSAFGHLRADYGIAWAATMVSVIFILGLLILPFAPETKGKPLME